MKVVYDTNIHASVLAIPGGQALFAVRVFEGIRVQSVRQFPNEIELSSGSMRSHGARDPLGTHRDTRDTSGNACAKLGSPTQVRKPRQHPRSS